MHTFSTRPKEVDFVPYLLYQKITQKVGLPMFVKDSEKKLLSVVPGVQRKTLAVGANTLMTKFVLAAGSELPMHKHPHEQIGFLVSGRLVLSIGDESCDLLPGDSWAVPGDVEHCAKVIEDSEAIEVFFPVRQDYL